jgi:hypothetical protein
MIRCPSVAIGVVAAAVAGAAEQDGPEAEQDQATHDE